MTNAARCADVIVIGAGPAGAVAARELARRGLEVLVVDKATFPRDKVCGCTLDARAQRTLERLALAGVLAALSPRAITTVTIAARGRAATLPLRSTVAVSRERFDHAMLEAAIACGARVRLGVRIARIAHVADKSALRVEGSVAPEGAGWNGISRDLAGRNGTGRDSAGRNGDVSPWVATARVVVGAGGLSDHSLGSLARIERHARIGVAATLERDAWNLDPAALVMAVGRSGYAGLVRLEDGRIRVAAALAANSISSAGAAGLKDAIAAVFDDAGLVAVAGLEHVMLRATPPLSRSRDAVAEPGVFAVGDACGYVEPFSGEGIAWALRSAELAAPFVAAALAGDAAAHLHYDAAWRRAIGEHRGAARRLQSWGRHPRFVSAMLVAARIAPRLARAWMPS